MTCRTSPLDEAVNVAYNSGVPSPDATTIRLTPEDRRILSTLKKLTGLESNTAIIRLMLREGLASRGSRRRDTARGRT